MNIYYNTLSKTTEKLSTMEIGNQIYESNICFYIMQKQLKTFNQNIVKCQKKAEERAADIWTSF